MPVGYTPIYRIMKDGVDITDKFNDRATSIQVELTNSGQPDTVNITIDDRGFEVDMPSVGALLEVYLGYKEVGLAQQGVFEINAITFQGPPREIVITGTAIGFIGALKAPAIKEFENKTAMELYQEIAKSAGTSALVHESLSQKRIPFLNQITSPLHLQFELDRRLGVVSKFVNGQLQVVPRDEGVAYDGQGQPILVLKPEHFGQWQVKHTQRSSFSGVKAAWWDPTNHVMKWVEEAFPRGNAPTDGDDTGNPAPVFRGPNIHNSEEEAKDWAKSQMKALNRALGEANITLAKGDPWVRDQMRVIISGMREGINGSYIIETVKHSYTKNGGLATEILAKPPGTNEDFSSLDDGQYHSPLTGFTTGPGGRAAGPV